MSYILVSDPIENYVKSNWVQTKHTSFLKKEIYARGAHLVLVPISAFTSAVDSLAGAVLGAACIATAGKNIKILNISMMFLDG